MATRVLHLIPHTHWDREWYRTRAGFLARLVPAVDDLLDRLEADEAYRTFLLDGQTVLIEDYLRVRPDQDERVRTLVRAGRLQTGPWYVLADELIPTGESLVRNLLLGTADASGLGRRSEALYSPDAFGHPAEWPMLAAEFGLPVGALWRGLGGRAGEEGDLYRWHGPDGSEVVIYHLPPDGYEFGAALPADPETLRARWADLRPLLLARAASPHVAIFVGADHHAAHPTIPALRAGLAALEPDADVRVSRLDEFLAAAVAARVGERPLPVLNGELRWSYGYTWTLQGVHGTRAPFKRRHAEVELRLLRIAEPLAATAALAGHRAERALLAESWRALVQSQFHDTIGGCAADDVIREAELRVAGAGALAEAVAERALHGLVGHDPDAARDQPDEVRPRLVLWNPAARSRDGVVVADLTWFRRDVFIGPPGSRRPRSAAPPGAFALRGADGPVAVQVLGRKSGLDRFDSARHYPDQDEVETVRVAFRSPRVPGLGTAFLDPDSSESAERLAAAGDCWSRGRTIGNELITVQPDASGGWRVDDRASGARLDDLMHLEWEPDLGDTYTFCPGAAAQRRQAGAPAGVRVLATGPLVASFEAQWELPVASVRVVASVHAGSRAARFTIELDARGSDYRLRLRSPSGVRPARALAGGAFGGIDREPLDRSASRAYPNEQPAATAPAHRYVAVAGSGGGLALFAPGFFEYELDEDGDLIFTVLRAVGELSRADLATRPGHAGWPTATPMAQCRGADRLQLALAPWPVTVPLRHDALIREWEDLFLPVRAIWLRQSLPLRTLPSGIELEGDGLVVSAIKPADSGVGIIVRCLNATDEPREAGWRLPHPAAQAWLTRADERPGDPIPLQEDGCLIRVTVPPRSLASVRIEGARVKG